MVSMSPVSGPVAWMWYEASQACSAGKMRWQKEMSCITKTSWRRSSLDLTNIDVSFQPGLPLASSLALPMRATLASHPSRLRAVTSGVVASVMTLDASWSVSPLAAVARAPPCRIALATVVGSSCTSTKSISGQRALVWKTTLSCGAKRSTCSILADEWPSGKNVMGGSGIALRAGCSRGCRSASANGRSSSARSVSRRTKARCELK
mmetsp:Transcript_55887/g.133939  ORF Transcript_55887/g.133939 Transcript_55887/m.133939 type:complete len:207 (-) Transcript_55887:1090-1710(-)